jgi:hypothetical protein
MKTLLSLFLISISLSSFSQFGIPLIQERYEYSPLRMNKDQKIQRELIKEETQKMDDFMDYNERITKLPEILKNKKELTLDGWALGQWLLIETYILDIIENDSCIYNLALSSQEIPDYEEDTFLKSEKCATIIDKCNKGYDFVISLFDEAIQKSDEKNATFFRRKRLEYLYSTSYADLLYHYDFQNKISSEEIEHFNYTNISEQLSNSSLNWSHPLVYNKIAEDYKTTNKKPQFGYAGINLGLSSMYGKDLWVGGELSVDAVSNANPFKTSNDFDFSPNFRQSYFGLSLMKNMGNDNLDFSYYALRLTNLYFLNLNLFQFGYQTGPSFTKELNWYYRPEIGFTYGIFSLTYSYNLMFDKSVRAFTEKNCVNLKITYPLFKVVEYDY